MAITASGLFGLTLEKIFRDTLGVDLENETTIKAAMITDAATPAFDTHDFWDDLSTNEVSGTGYTAGGMVLTATELLPGTVGGSPAGVLTYDAIDASWTTSTISNAMAAVGYNNTGSAATSQLIWLSDFVTAASSSAGTFTVQWAAPASGGIWNIDYTP